MYQQGPHLKAPKRGKQSRSDNSNQGQPIVQLLLDKFVVTRQVLGQASLGED